MMLLDGPEPLVLLLLALVIDAYLGDWAPADRVRGLPTAPLRRLIVQADRRLNRIHRTESTRRARGVLVAVTVSALALGAGWLAAALARAVPWGWVLELWLLLDAVALRHPWNRSRAVLTALGTADIEAARQAVQGLSDRPGWGLDIHAVVRAAVEGLARGITRGLVAPAFWYLLAGLPGLLLWRAAEAMDSIIGRQTGRYEGFGMAAARLNDALTWLPARLSALLTAAGALFVATAAPGGALRTALSDGPRHASRNVGWPLAAFAGALGLALGGPRREGEVTIKAPWIGKGRARAEPTDLRRALLLYVAVCLVSGGMIGGLGLATAL